MEELSQHLFWDVDRETIDPEIHVAWLAKRVLERGRWADWKWMEAKFGRERLAEVVVNLRSLEPRAFAFCQARFDRAASEFRCSTTTPFRAQSPSC
ncbi:DUF6922 domain-containing protein [Haloferula sp.]|uniref:DUF6922 domain-containing protein n=1 Tax=Haloferula sp. TaxID=2497595 RepID=UPI003C713090